MTYLLWIIASATAFAFGEYFSKYYGMWQSWQDLVAVFFCYNLGVLLWLPAIVQKKDLAIVGAIWSVLSLVATVGIGVGFFQEKLDPVHWIGFALAVVSVALLSR